MNNEKMDLMTAKVKAAELSKKGKKIYIQVDADGDCTTAGYESKGSEYLFFNGSEDKNFKPGESVVEQEPKPKQKTSVMKNEKTSPAKKAVKKVEPAKKAEKKVAPAKKVETKGGIAKATTLTLTAAQWKKLEALDMTVRQAASEAIVKHFKL